MQTLINVDVDDLAKAETFYRDAFGLKRGRQLGEGALEMLGGSSPVYLLLKPPGTLPFPDASSKRDYRRHWTPVHLDFVVDDLESALARAIGAGAVLQADVQISPGAVWRSWPTRSAMGSASSNSSARGTTLSPSRKRGGRVDEHHLILYHIAPSRSSIVHWMLEEIGQPYELRVLDMKKGENRQPDFLKINPMGKVPTLVHDGVVITEGAAICTYLADAFPDAGLSVPIGDPRRGPYLKWLFFAPGALEPAMMDAMLKREPGPVQALGYGSMDMVLDVLAAAVEPSPYLLGEQFTAADVVLGASIHWGMMAGGLPKRPALVAYAERIAARPAFQRAMQKDQKLAADSQG